MQGWCEASDRKLEQAAVVMKGVCVMKGIGVERGGAASSVGGRVVNLPLERNPSAGDASCQERVDTKAFTGRGSHRELRQLEAEVDRLDQQMRSLSSASKQIAGAQLSLMLHQRHATGYQFLRWREVGGNKRHLNWEEAEALYQRYSAPMRAWYLSVSQQAKAVNEAHLKCRREIKSMRYWIGKAEQAVYARPIPE